MRQDLQYLRKTMALGAKAIAENHFNPDNKDESIGLMHLGNEHISLPSFLLADPVLEIIDKGIYSTIRLLTPKGLGNNNVAYPSYDKISKIANVGSHATISRALAILRITRWLTSKQVTSSSGVIANVYITHDHPLDIVDMEAIDDGYMEYVTKCLTHHHNRVRQVAQMVLNQYESDLLEGKDPAQPTHHLEYIAEANQYINGNNDTSYFGLSSYAIEHLKQSRYKNNPSLKIKEPDNLGSSNIEEHLNQLLTSKTEELNPIPSSNTEEPVKSSSLNIEEPSSSCSNLNITTTSNTQGFYISVEPDKQLQQLIENRFTSLKSEQHYRIARLLMRINPEDRESMVYEVSNRIRFGTKEISNPVGYIGRLCGLLKKGEYPFSDFSFPDYQVNEAPDKPVLSQSKQQENELAGIKKEISNHWAELKSLENLQALSPTTTVQQSISQTKEKLKELSERRQQLEDLLQVVHGGPP